MSSPIQNDRDPRSMYIPSWAREASSDPFDTLSDAVERLRRERPLSLSQGEGYATRGRHEPEKAPQPEQLAGDLEAEISEIVRVGWRPASLDPVTMPPPPKQNVRGPTWGMVVRLGGAVGFAAVVALFVAGAIPLSSISIPFTMDKQASAAAVVRAVSISLATPSVATPAVVAPDHPALAVVPAFAPATDGVAAGLPILQPEMSQPTAMPSLATPNVAEPRPMAREEVALLLTRAQDMISQGDIAAARLLLTRAAEAGDAQAAFTLAGTYDLPVLTKMKVIGVVADSSRARNWYIKAAALGSVEAARRLEQFANRAD